MEFTQRGAQVQPPQHSNHESHVSSPNDANFGGKSKKRYIFGLSRWLRLATAVLLLSVTVLVLAIASLLYSGNGNETRFVNTSKFQAVDLNVGGSSSSDQIYFGHILKLNDKYLELVDIYYIVPNQQAQASNNYTLVKLGCELHAPYDQMIINRDHVVFWENLQSNGTVAQKIAQYQQQNPNGPNCSTSGASSAASASSSATSTQTTTTPTTTTTKKP